MSLQFIFLNIFCHRHYLSSELLPSPLRRWSGQGNMQCVNMTVRPLWSAPISLSLFVVTTCLSLGTQTTLSCLWSSVPNTLIFSPLLLTSCPLRMNCPFPNFFQKTFVKLYCSLPDNPLHQSSTTVILVTLPYGFIIIKFSIFTFIYLLYTHAANSLA